MADDICHPRRRDRLLVSGTAGCAGWELTSQSRLRGHHDCHPLPRCAHHWRGTGRGGVALELAGRGQVVQGLGGAASLWWGSPLSWASSRITLWSSWRWRSRGPPAEPIRWARDEDQHVPDGRFVIVHRLQWPPEMVVQGVLGGVDGAGHGEAGQSDTDGVAAPTPWPAAVKLPSRLEGADVMEQVLVVGRERDERREAAGREQRPHSEDEGRRTA